MGQYDYSKLNGKIVEVCGTRAIFSKQMGVSEHTISVKLNGKAAFTQKNIEKAIDVLRIPRSEVAKYFFVLKVHKCE